MTRLSESQDAPSLPVVDSIGVSVRVSASMPANIKLAYYCSGHGYGHATRVSAFASALLALENKPTIHIVTSAPKRVFAACIADGASYRFAKIDPVVVQPLAYRIDRRKSLRVLKDFLDAKDANLSVEVDWLKAEGVDCVLTDAAFLACYAAHASGIPSILVTNFTFDSVFSYLTTTRSQSSSDFSPAIYSFSPVDPGQTDELISSEEMEPLVNEILQGYQLASRLILLPGHIPIPSFMKHPPLPATSWIKSDNHAICSFSPEITEMLSSQASTKRPECVPPTSSLLDLDIPRDIVTAPLLVRLPSRDIYTPAGRSRFLTSIGVPEYLHNPQTTHILVVSFGGQLFHRPSSSGRSSRASSRPSSPQAITKDLSTLELVSNAKSNSLLPPSFSHEQSSPVATPTHLYVPGAPPVANLSLQENGVERSSYISVKPLEAQDPQDPPFFLPSDSWIAIICGAATDSQTSDLPESFYLAPQDVYMPDLTACCDVMLGKLGYGTVSECVSCGTPLVYVSRPLFIEEYGLRLYLGESGVGIELSTAQYESGDWWRHVEEAWVKGKAMKDGTRSLGETGRQRLQGLSKYLAIDTMRWLENLEPSIN